MIFTMLCFFRRTSSSFLYDNRHIRENEFRTLPLGVCVTSIGKAVMLEFRSRFKVSGIIVVVFSMVSLDCHLFHGLYLRKLFHGMVYQQWRRMRPTRIHHRPRRCRILCTRKPRVVFFRTIFIFDIGNFNLRATFFDTIFIHL